MGFPSLTNTWHSKSYAAIDPSRPEVAQKGKVVAITGAGGSIGGAAASAFARAGADKIGIIGRREKPLHETKAEIEKAVPGTKVLVVSGDIADSSSTSKAFEAIHKELGPIDILVCNAGYLPSFSPLESAEPEEWWKGYEINVKGAFNCIRAFHANAAPKGILVDVSTCVVHMPAMAQGSAYVSSKLAATKVYETFGMEHPEYEVVHIHPGVIYSELNVKSGVTATDEADLPGNFILWACSPEADFLRGGGKYLWSNWDVDELKSRKAELEPSNQLTITMNGWPFPYGSDGSKDALKF